MSKPKAGFYWCASCGGCEESVVDLAEDLLGVVEAIDLVFFPVAMDFKREDVDAMADGEMAVCFINGSIRSSEQLEMVELLRRKSQLVVAYGSCAHMGGVPGLANLYSLEEIIRYVYEQSPSTVNPDRTRPVSQATVPEGKLTLPTLDDCVKSLGQVVQVDYYLPGCPPPVKLLKSAVQAILSGQLPSKGSVLAPDHALCKDCPRIGSKPDNLAISRLCRPHEILIDHEKCLLAQGILCLGPATRSGCDAACIQGNMPCSGCMGPMGRIRDHGGAAMSALASLIEGTDEQQIARALENVPDPAGTFYRYGVPASTLFRRNSPANSGGQ